MTPAEFALARLLWRSVADLESCSCFHGKQCDLCPATEALGLGRWRGPLVMAEALSEWGHNAARNNPSDNAK